MDIRSASFETFPSLFGRHMTEGYITYTTGAGGTWIAWHTESRPPENATGRDLMACAGAVCFAVGPTADDALARLRAEHAIHPLSGRPR